MRPSKISDNVDTLSQKPRNSMKLVQKVDAAVRPLGQFSSSKTISERATESGPPQHLNTTKSIDLQKIMQEIAEDSDEEDNFNSKQSSSQSSSQTSNQSSKIPSKQTVSSSS